MAIDVGVLQELPSTTAETAEGCCATRSVFTCPTRTFDIAPGFEALLD